MMMKIFSVLLIICILQAKPRNVEPEIRDLALLGSISTTKGEFTITQVLERSSRSDGILMKSQYYE